MNASNGAGVSSTGTLEPSRKSGIRTALEFTGIPATWLSKRPKLPSRNWLIFLTFTSSITGLYFYDRWQCKNIRRQYIERVRHLAAETMGSLDWPRKVTVYGCKWPGDEEYDRSIKYFRKYVKPIFVAAAVDYEMINGKRHGDLANRIADEIKSRRRIALGLDVPRVPPMPLPLHKSPEETRQHELGGGIVIVGRHTFKEFMAGLKRGWTDSPEKVDKEELLARELQSDGHFDEPDELPMQPQYLDEDLVTSSSRVPSSKNSPVYSPLKAIGRPYVPAPRPTQQPLLPTSVNSPPPPVIPPLPPLLFVHFINYIGFTQIPLMIWDFFNQRHKVRSGAEAAYCLIEGNVRPFEAPPATFDEQLSATQIPCSDLEFDREAETYYKTSLSSIPADIEKARKKYYDALPNQLETARAISRGTREMTKEERENPPPSEVELRAERMKKEKRWRGDLEGWEIVKPEQNVVWDERFTDALRVFVDSRNGDQT